MSSVNRLRRNGVDWQHVTKVCEALVCRLGAICRLCWHHGCQAVLISGNEGTLFSEHLKTDFAHAKVDGPIAWVLLLLYMFTFSLFYV